MIQIFSQVPKYFQKKDKNKESSLKKKKKRRKKKEENPYTLSCKIQAPTLNCVWSFLSFGFPQDMAYCIGLDAVLPVQLSGQAQIPTTKSPWQVPK